MPYLLVKRLLLIIRNRNLWLILKKILVTSRDNGLTPFPAKPITFESKAYKELDNKITAIADYIFNHMETARQSEEDMWVDSYEVCTFLKISEKTLQRLRVSGTIAYSNIRGRYFYKVSEIRRMLEERLIRSNKENIDNLITNHQLYAKERGNLRKNK